MALFDSYLVVDWSAAATPKLGRDSIWSCLLGPDGTELVNHPTRAVFESWLTDTLRRLPGRVLAGFDFSFGYPAGFARALGLGGPAWSATWTSLAEAITDDERNRNNRFAVAARWNLGIGDAPGPFWGCPPAAASGSLAVRKPEFPCAGLDEYRNAERAMHAAGHRVFSSWQLLGVGSVGSQSLMGVPLLARLLRSAAFGGRLEVWPFTTGLVADPTAGRADTIVLAEVWPSWIPVDPGAHAVRDAAQVLGLARRLEHLDQAGELGAGFAPDVADAAVADVCEEEGWILGAGWRPAPT